MLFLFLLVAQLALFDSEPQSQLQLYSKHTDSTTTTGNVGVDTGTGGGAHPPIQAHAQGTTGHVVEKFIHSSLHDDDNPCLDIIDFLAYKRTCNFTGDVHGEPSFSVVKGLHMFNIQFSCGHLLKATTDDQLGDPKVLHDLTLGRKIAVVNESYMGDRQRDSMGVNRWNASNISMLAKDPCSYDDSNPSCELAFNKYNYLINGSHGIVVGSHSFWAEAAALRHGARHITTIQLQLHVISNTDHHYHYHPQLSLMTPHETYSRYLNHTMRKADFIIAQSSLEHDGLDMLGDPMSSGNAFGDLLSVARMNCMLKNHGILFLVVPVGIDAVVQYNSQRIYGYHRLSMLFSLGNHVCTITVMYCFVDDDGRRSSST